MTQQQLGALLASLCAATVLSSSVYAEDAAKTATAEPMDGEHLCQNNSCKGQSECAGYGNSCAGHNEKKNQGWVSASDAKECASKKGIWHGKDAKKAAPQKSEPKKG